MSVRDSFDGFTKDKFLLNLKNNPDVETFATLTELPYGCSQDMFHWFL